MSVQPKVLRLASLATLLALVVVSTAGAETIARSQSQAQTSETLADLLARKAAAAELFAHPEWIEAERLADARAEVETAETYATPEAKAKRPFVFDGEEIVGYEAALPHLVAMAKAFAPDGQVAAGKRAVLVIGAPGSGKSTLAAKIAARERAGIVDADLVKEALPEYDDGRGTQAVHRESAEIAHLVANAFILRGENFIWPRTGSTASSIRRIAETAKAHGYSVDLINVDVSEDESARRVVKRFLETGRMVQARFVKEARTRAHKTYEELKRDGVAGRYAELDSTESWPWPILQDGEAVAGLLGGDAATARRSDPALRAAEAAQVEAQVHLELGDLLMSSAMDGAKPHARR
jgi:predicted ABC-type ATPase